MNNVPGFAPAFTGGGPADALGFGPGGGARRSPEQQRPLWTEETDDTTEDDSQIEVIFHHEGDNFGCLVH